MKYFLLTLGVIIAVVAAYIFYVPTPAEEFTRAGAQPGLGAPMRIPPTPAIFPATSQAPGSRGGARNYPPPPAPSLNRGALTKKFGAPQHFNARVGQHLSSEVLALQDRKLGDFVLFFHPSAASMHMGDQIEFDAWAAGTVQVKAVGGSKKSVPRMVYAGAR